MTAVGHSHILQPGDAEYPMTAMQVPISSVNCLLGGIAAVAITFAVAFQSGMPFRSTLQEPATPVAASDDRTGSMEIEPGWTVPEKLKFAGGWHQVYPDNSRIYATSVNLDTVADWYLVQRPDLIREIIDEGHLVLHAEGFDIDLVTSEHSTRISFTPIAPDATGNGGTYR